MTDKLRIVRTIPEIAKRLNMTTQAVEWVIEDLAILPDPLAGNARLYNEDAVNRISDELQGKC
jgi:hypothetical protein